MGLATARAFAENGASVVLADLDADLAEHEARRIVGEGGTAIGAACDVADELQVAKVVDLAVAKFGRLDMAFNNAGIQVPPSDAADEPLENFERHRRQPARRMGVHEARTASDARSRLRCDR
jgi:NAD(P)-dependent dehydrogenase (short-subunit alcohol dehydrogenase family)